jgi:hypothetical protein
LHRLDLSFSRGDKNKAAHHWRRAALQLGKRLFDFVLKINLGLPDSPLQLLAFICSCHAGIRLRGIVAKRCMEREHVAEFDAHRVNVRHAVRHILAGVLRLDHAGNLWRIANALDGLDARGLEVLEF